MEKPQRPYKPTQKQIDKMKTIGNLIDDALINYTEEYQVNGVTLWLAIHLRKLPPVNLVVYYRHLAEMVELAKEEIPY